MYYIASDHAGYKLKSAVIKFLKIKGIEIKDLGPYTERAGDDYPDFIIPLAEKVANTENKGIISCRNGQGAAIVANKVDGIRAVVAWNESVATSSRIDDDTNILSLPADYIDEHSLEPIVMSWIETPFSGQARHLRRIHKISDYERER